MKKKKIKAKKGKKQLKTNPKSRIIPILVSGIILLVLEISALMVFKPVDVVEKRIPIISNDSGDFYRQMNSVGTGSILKKYYNKSGQLRYIDYCLPGKAGPTNRQCYDKEGNVEANLDYENIIHSMNEEFVEINNLMEEGNIKEAEKRVTLFSGDYCNLLVDWGYKFPSSTFVDQFKDKLDLVKKGKYKRYKSLKELVEKIEQAIKSKDAKIFFELADPDFRWGYWMSEGYAKSRHSLLYLFEGTETRKVSITGFYMATEEIKGKTFAGSYVVETVGWNLDFGHGKKDVVDFMFSKKQNKDGNPYWIWNSIMFGFEGGKDELVDGYCYKKVSRDELVGQ